MAYAIVADRVKETTTSTGTGPVTLLGAYQSYVTFLDRVGAGNLTYYCISHEDGNAYEVGIGYALPTPARFIRQTVLQSSNNDTFVNFQPGQKDVFVTLPSHRAVLYSIDGVMLPLSSSVEITGDLTLDHNLIAAGSSSVNRLVATTDVTASAFKGNGAQILGVVTSSFAQTTLFANSASAANHALQADNAVTASFATSVLATGITPGTMSGAFAVGGDLSVSGFITAKEFHTTVVSSSIVYQSGSTKFGDTYDDVMSVTGSLQVSGSQTLVGTRTQIGNVNITGVQTVTGSVNIQGTGSATYMSASVLTATAITGSAFKGDGTQIVNVISSSYAVTSSFAQTTLLANTASAAGFAVSSSFSQTGLFANSASAANHALQADNAVSSSYALSSSFASNALTANTASFATSVLSSGITPGTMSGAFVLSGSLLVTGSQTLIGSRTQIGNLFITGTQTVTGSVNIQGTGSSTYMSASVLTATSITGSSFKGDGSQIINVISSSYAVTSSFAQTTLLANTASAAGFAVSSSFSQTGLFANSASAANHALQADNAVSSSYALSSSFASNALTSNTSSFATSVLATGITPGTLNGAFVLSGSFFVTGSETLVGTRTHSGSLAITGSSTVTGSVNIQGTGSATYMSASVLTATSITGSSFKGDGTQIVNVISSSYAVTSSFAQATLTANSASYATTASYAVTSSFAQNALTANSASYATTSSYSNTSTFATTAATASYIGLPFINTTFKYYEKFAGAYGQKIQITNFPSVATELDSSLRLRQDFTNIASASLGARIERSGSAGAQLALQYSFDDITWNYLDNVSGPFVALNASGTIEGTPVTIPSASRAPITLRVVAVGGDNASTVEFGSVVIGLTNAVPLYASANRSVGYKQMIPFTTQYGTNISLTNVSSSVAEVDTNLRTKYDLSKIASASLAVRVNVSGSTGTQLAAQYSTDEVTWNYLDGATGPSVLIDSTGSLLGSEFGLTKNAQATVVLRLVSLNGSGSVTPEVGNIALVLNSALPFYAVNDASIASTGSAGFQFLGDLTGSNASFNTGASGSVRIGQDASAPAFNMISINGSLTEGSAAGISGKAGDGRLFYYAATGSYHRFAIGPTGYLDINTTAVLPINAAYDLGATGSMFRNLYLSGNAIVSGSGTFLGQVTIAPTAPTDATLIMGSATTSQVAGMKLQTTNVGKWFIGTNVTATDNRFEFYNYTTGTSGFRIDNATNATTFAADNAAVQIKAATVGTATLLDFGNSAGTSVGFVGFPSATSAGSNMYIGNRLVGSIWFNTNNTNRWIMDSSGHFLAGTDNSYDIGASGANRPRNVYVTGTVAIGGSTAPANGAKTFGFSSTYGNYISCGAGSTNDFSLFNSAGAYVMYNDGGTNTVRMPGTLVLGALQVSGGATIVNTGPLIATFDTSYSTGGYLQWSNSGAPKGLWGDAATIISGATYNDFAIRAQNNLVFASNGGVGRWLINTSGHLLSYGDNSYDIGASGASRPRNVYVAGNVIAGGQVNATNYNTVTGGNSLTANTATPVLALPSTAVPRVWIVEYDIGNQGTVSNYNGVAIVLTDSNSARIAFQSDAAHLFMTLGSTGNLTVYLRNDTGITLAGYARATCFGA